MPFVKLDTGILNSTLWIERECRDIFITSLLMAEPREFDSEQKQLAIRNIEETGFSVPPGWYGFVPAAGIGIIRQALVDTELGMMALEKLGSPDAESRSPEHEGRRMIRVNGGFLILNFMKYRDRDYTAAERQKRLRERRKQERNGVTSRDSNVTSRIAESRVQSTESDNSKPLTRSARKGTRIPENFVPKKEHYELGKQLGIIVDMEFARFRDYWLGVSGSRATKLDWDATLRNWLRTAAERGTSFAKEDKYTAFARKHGALDDQIRLS